MTPSIPNPIGDFIRANVPIPELAYLINVILCICAICAVAFGSAMVLVYMERKVCAHVQCRLGPMRLGFHGTIQIVADTIKLMLKEVYATKGVDKLLFFMAPMVLLTAPFMSLTMIPFGPNLQVAEVPVAVPLIIAVNGFGILGILLGGWASNNKYSLLGSLRSGAQMISYEISYCLILLFIVMLAGSASFRDITMSQQGTIIDWWIFKAPVIGVIAFIMFLISSTAELNRAPFDIAEAEQELTGGYHTEYNGMGFAMFYLAEYINLVTTSSLATVFFFGGFLPPCIGIAAVDHILNFVPGVIWFFVKVFVMIWVYMMIRWTLVRPRVDQLMSLEWKFLLPMNLILLVLGAVFISFGWIIQ
ncbi:complex I subunit 1/NuoH family protein [Hallerella porci]|uniref:NADH-quinone oxidoreductase subunit H n=1 Tax=Hallerella porci TaxID=1945871 RepID=A0ABX5LMW8_9BACT|nr:complex I subunit 1 family protein [Hallerella porci]PWL03774.1 NADH:ubiquinone oxidoreductase subunit H [Hallerella porci]